MEKYFKNLNKNKCIIVLIIFLIFLVLSNNFFHLISFLNIYLDAVLAIVAILGLLFGQSWLNTSKKKMKGQLDFDLARKYLKIVLKIRDTIKIVRAPFIPIGEIQNALQENGFSADEYNNKEKVNRSVYSLRWEKVQEAWSSLDEVLLDAEVSWGVEAIETQKGLDELIKKLRSVIWLFVNNGESFESTEGENFKILYGTHDENDEFAKNINLEIKKIINFLKKHL